VGRDKPAWECAFEDLIAVLSVKYEWRSLGTARWVRENLGSSEAWRSETAKRLLELENDGC
jgi:hypothetical protein